MAVDLLEREGGPPRPSPGRTAAVVLVAAALVVGGVLQVRGEPSSSAGLLTGAEVLSVRPSPDGGLHVRIAVLGPPRAQLRSVRVELPGSAVDLQPAPGRLTDDGTGLLAVDVLPSCPDAVPGLARASVSADVGRRAGARVQHVRVPLETAGQLERAVRWRCRLGTGRPTLRASAIELEGPPGVPLRTSVAVSASDAGAVTVVGVRPGPGLEATVATALPLRLVPGQAPRTVRVYLRPGECGTPPDTVPFVLVLASGEAVPPRVAPELLPGLDALRPRPC